MLQLNQTAFTFDPAEFLESQPGIYQLTSPGGEIFQAEVRQGQCIVSLRPTGRQQARQQPSQSSRSRSQQSQQAQQNNQNQGGWQVRKIGEVQYDDQQQQQQYQQFQQGQS